MHFRKVSSSIYIALENLLMKATNKEYFSKELTIVTEYNDTDFVPEPLREKCPNTELFLVRIQENTDQK